MLKAIIIDDEEMGRIALQKKIGMCGDRVEILESVSSAKEGIEAIGKHRPDLVFLDIEMPGMNGFQMLEHLKERNFHLIFTTAYDHYAIKAIKYSAIDYLLKPVDIDALQEAILKVNTLKKDFTQEKVEVLQNNMKSPLEKIAIPVLDGYIFIRTNEMTHLHADGNYTTIYLSDGSKIVASRILKDFEELLSPDIFCRPHHSHIINLNFIKRYIKGEGGQIELENGHYIPVSRRKKEEFLNKIKML